MAPPGDHREDNSAEDRARERTRAASLHARIRRLGRLAVVCWVLFRETVRFRRFSSMTAEERRRHPDAPKQLLASLLALGPTFVKIGQILSTRPDLVPGEYIDELEQLQERVPPFPFEEVRRILERELGSSLSAAFLSLDEHPVASASLSQVHLALLGDGSEVAVKVQRPGVKEAIEEDMRVLGLLVTLASRLFPKTSRNLNLLSGFEEFRRYTLQELDFLLEARTLERFRRNFQDWPDVVFPDVHRRYTTSRVLTMSRVSGLRLKEVAARMAPEARRRLNSRLLELEMKMFVSDGFFHADLHPGNIFFSDDGKIALLDFGMYGEITERQRDHFILYFLAVVQHETRRAFYHLVSLTTRSKGADEEAYYRRFKVLAEQFYHSTLAEMSMTQVYLQILLAGSRYGFVFPSDLLLHAKAVTTAEALMLTLTPGLKFEEEARPIVIRHYVDRALDVRRIKSQVERILPEVLLFGELPPAAVADEEGDGSESDRLWREMGLAVAANTHLWELSVELLPRVMTPFVRQALGDLYSTEAIGDIVGRMREHYRALEPTVPRQQTAGGDLMIHLAAFTIAMYRTLVDLGHAEDRASRLVYDIAWRAYRRMGDVPWVLSGKFGQDRSRRLKFALDAFLTFPFSSPAYQWKRVDAGEGVYAFDMVRCPVAEYFRSYGLADLCVQTWCNLDFPLAKEWGGATLERTETLADGGRRCDFRWISRFPFMEVSGTDRASRTVQSRKG